MRARSLILSAVLLTGAVGAVQADTIIETLESGHKGQTEISGHMIRMGTPEGYMLVDTHSAKMYGVDPQRRVIRDFGTMKPRPAGKATAGAKLSGPKSGPSIAGYPTKIYTLRVGGEHCGTFYVSKKALKLEDVHRMARFFANHKFAFEDMAKGLGESACEQADQSMTGQLMKLGMPMREIDAQGRTSYEITAIKTDVSIPRQRMALPKGYSHKDAVEEMNHAQQQMQQIQQQMQEQMKNMSPQQRQMLEQMMKGQNH